MCGQPDDQCWVHGGTAGGGEDLEDRDGEGGPAQGFVLKKAVQ